MNRVGATFCGAVLLMAVSGAGPAYATPTPSPAPPGPVTPSTQALPAGAPLPTSPGQVPPGSLPGPAPVPADPAAPPADPADPQFDAFPPTGDPVKDACDQFFEAGNLAASTYEEFADASEGSSNDLNYADPEVERTSLISRAALRSAAAAALDAAGIAGVPPEVSDPMRSWSLHATKLIFVIGLHGGRETMNNAVNQVNVDYGNAKQACAMTMAHGG